ncbi:ABC transporter permease (plasmid) [Deinococcus aetherius]|uniref:ABC transporter permease n=1 Tax=Deinococcus aetherius TaxID=200252 RepID=A0ABN6RRF8_9DEIO|nr:sugar ABC transporter permease [Deinococcus aetherius]BDP44317.1 ABC transporter permease [Deinococcus aetherius]
MTNASLDRAARPGPARRKRPFLDPRGVGWCYLFLAPMVLLYLGFVLWPTLASLYFSLFNWDGLGWPQQFVGMGNYREVTGDGLFWKAFGNTWKYTLGVVILQVPLALLVAVALNDPTLRGRTVYRTLFFLPVVTTTAVVGVVLAVMLSPIGGAVNTALLGSGLVDRPVNFLGTVSLALPTLIAIGIWKTFGIKMIYWLAGLQSVPAELYEAARLDGATGTQILRFVTLPLLRPVALTILVLALLQSLNVFDLVRVMTAGGPLYSTDVVSTYIYRLAFSAELGVPRFGYASAAGVIFGVTNLAIIAVQALATRAARRRERVL